MKLIDSKIQYLREEVASLAEHCQSLGDEKTRQLLLEVDELLEITHSTFLGKALNNITHLGQQKSQKH
uniref:hypothetical protein n=1 Tax=Ningiella ruwaisensis TaxID=2364274 RepID=UPI00109FFC81|nr:hypothetical protein [Ningiella ruwaisensis]